MCPPAETPELRKRAAEQAEVPEKKVDYHAEMNNAKISVAEIPKRFTLFWLRKQVPCPARARARSPPHAFVCVRARAISFSHAPVRARALSFSHAPVRPPSPPPRASQFRTHRLVGLAYLVQYFWALGLYVLDYERFLASPLVWSMPLTGVLQSTTAIHTFTFLPRKKEPGYTALGDVGALSYNYVVENQFFAGLLAFQWIYYDDRFFALIRRSRVLELGFVFLPYLPLIRFRWPVSSFRDGLNANAGKVMTDANRRFFVVSTYVVKAFYVFAKHYIGFYLNYTRFLGRVGPAEQRVMYGLLLGACWGTTIAMFIHTLKFKRFIGARAGALAYEASFPWMIFFFAKLLAMMAAQADLVAVASGGLLLNFANRRHRPVWHAYQLAVMAVMTRGIYW